MPVGLIIAATAAMASIGVGFGTKGGIDQSRAKRLNNNTQARLDHAKERLELQRKDCGDALNDLGNEKLNIINGSLARFVELYSQLKNVHTSEVEDLDELSKLHLDSKEFEEIKALTGFTASLLGGAGAGAVGGAAAGVGAYSAAMTFATASTGTAISTLSGAAATNATLAWFGGGSLAAGGAGMAGGAAVLGGIVAGPALLAMGAIVGATGHKNLEKARTNAWETNDVCEQLENGAQECIAIRRRCHMFYALLAHLDAYLTPLTFAMERVFADAGMDYSSYTAEQKAIFATAASTAKSVKAAMDTVILTEDGALTEESAEVAEKMLEEAGAKEMPDLPEV